MTNRGKTTPNSTGGSYKPATGQKSRVTLDGAPASRPQPLTAAQGLDYGRGAPRQTDGTVYDFNDYLNGGIQGSTPYDRGELGWAQDDADTTDQWSVRHGGMGTFMSGKTGYSAYGAYSKTTKGTVWLTSGAFWEMGTTHSQADADRIWRNRGAISQHVMGDREGFVRSEYTYVDFHDDGTMSIAGYLSGAKPRERVQFCDHAPAAP